MLSCFSHVPLFATLWIVAHQAPLSIGFLSQEYRGGLPFSSSEDIPDPGIKLMSPVAPVLLVDYLLLSHQGSPNNKITYIKKIEYTQNS